MPMGVYTRTAEHKAKIGAAQRGRPRPQTTGAKNGWWAGDRVGYDGVHKRFARSLPEVCAHEDGTCSGRLEVALRHEAPPEHLLGVAYGQRKGKFYSRHEQDYLRLCKSHHVRYDAVAKPPGEFCAKGHRRKLTARQWVCGQCKNEAKRRRKELINA
jgi:hypothetical protein